MTIFKNVDASKFNAFLAEAPPYALAYILFGSVFEKNNWSNEQTWPLSEAW